MVTQLPETWVLLSYRMPREPSTPRIAVWRKLKNLGVGKLGDGLVALPNDPRNKEQLEWLAGEIAENDGESIVWVATTAARRDGKKLAQEMTDARNVEYQALVTESQTDGLDGRAVSRLRREWRRIDRRDYFGATLRDQARLAIADLADLTDTSPDKAEARP